MHAQWHDICSLKRLEREQRLSVRQGEYALLMLLVNGQPLVFENRCPHLGYPLEAACVDSEQGTLTCPFHQWVFALDSGRCQLNTACLKRFPVRVEQGRVQVGIPADPC